MTTLLISAARKSSGKTVIAVGLSAALAKRGFAVQTFKKGPDYIDPMWLTAASNRPCRNLDYNVMDQAEIRAYFASHSGKAEISLIEGSKGLHDGLDPQGKDSTAALAKLLGSPVALVIDAQGLTRGIAPLILGHTAFDRNLSFAGIILNKVANARHERKLLAAIKNYTDLPVLGAVGRSLEMEITERHLGLVPPGESARAKEMIAAIAARVEDQVDIGLLLGKAKPAPIASAGANKATPAQAGSESLRIAIARDAAFGFYYPDDLEGLQSGGAALIEFDTLNSSVLPQADALFIGGGFPEIHMQALAANGRLRAQIRAAIEGGLPAYAECGGLMYLSRSIIWNGGRSEMAGVIEADAVMREAPAGRGYVKARETGKSLWPAGASEFNAHEFHYSALENWSETYDFAYQILRGEGLGKGQDGVIHKNLLASFIHLRDVAGNRWTRRFIEFARKIKNAS